LGWLIAFICIIVLVIIYLIVMFVLRTYRKQVATGREDLIGKVAVVKTALEPKGLVLVEGERWTAVIDGGSAAPDEEVIVTKVEGLVLKVTKIQQKGGS
jgi:membrane-bound serine protease (ClpP class)